MGGITDLLGILQGNIGTGTLDNYAGETIGRWSGRPLKSCCKCTQ